jgi:mRNA deadenylase 3'-5' endonuclease subunit Ccr4/uncharacterized protein with PIN domain
MAKKKKASGKKKRSSPNKRATSSSVSTSDNWVDRLEFEPVRVDEEPENALEIRVVSWNILAQNYLSRRSHRKLPLPYDEVVFVPKRRQALLSKTLKRLLSLELDILCLQEVDLELVDATLSEEQFEGISTPTTKGGGAGSRVDACCIYWKKDEWELLDQEFICFDDLSTMGSNATLLASNLQGLKQSLLRRNVGVMVRLQHKETATKVVVTNSHLYWNPEYDYVKLCQAHYAMTCAKAFAKDDPVVICGDFNSQPHGPVHDYLTRGAVNAKAVAPWYNQRRDDGVQSMNGDEGDEKKEGVDKITEELTSLKVDESSSPQIKYMLDFTLNRFSRWLRILGIDAALESEEEEIQRTKHTNIVIFDRCREEGRTLVTTSSKLMARKDTPPGSYLINPKTLGKMEASLVHLLLSHGVVLEPKHFLTRCVVCNGNIVDVVEAEEKKRIFKAHQAPELSQDYLCYECDGCGQGYWFCDKPTSSASRVKNQAIHLFELCLRGGVDLKGPLHMFEEVDVEAEREKWLDVGIEMETLTILDWLKEEELPCPIELESSYALRDGNGTIIGECKPFTNVTSDFVGFLDYVLFEPTKCQITGRLYLPSSFNELNRKKNPLRNGHLLPSYAWPSDHLAVGAQISIPIESEASPELEAPSGLYSGVIESNPSTAPTVFTSASETSTSDLSALYCGVIKPAKGPPTTAPTVHESRCGCGCVPAILSLFEMAELRKQARLRAKQEAGNK